MCHFCWRWQHSTHILKRCVSWETDERFRQRIEIGPHPLNHAKTKVLNFSDHCLGVDSWVLLPECFIICLWDMQNASIASLASMPTSRRKLCADADADPAGCTRCKALKGGRPYTLQGTNVYHLWIYGRRHSSSIIFPATFKGSTLVSESVCCRGFSDHWLLLTSDSFWLWMAM